MEGIPDQGVYIPTISARIDEIKAIDNVLVSKEHGQRAYQKLPRHMQRRAMSANPRRLPRSIREKNMREIGNKMKVTKRPCRKYRRRPSNLLNEYNRRQKINKWLETHIWHAKRFHMVKRWGYVLPDSPTNKGYRATIRAVRETCLIQDISYESCFEIEAPSDDFVTLFASILSPKDKSALMNNDFLSGTVNKQITIYESGRYPLGAVGNSQIVAVPHQNRDCYRVWLWSHPCIAEDVLRIFVTNFDLVRLEEEKSLTDDKENLNEANLSKETEDTSNTDDPKKTCVAEGKNKNVEPNYPPQKTVKYICPTNICRKLTDMSGSLNKFRLCGPLSLQILRNVLLESDVTMIAENDKNSNIEESAEKICKFWWSSYFSNPSFQLNLVENYNQWANIKADDIGSKRVFGFVVRDVRCSLPEKKVSVEKYGCSLVSSTTQLDTISPCPALYESKIRDEVISSMLSSSVINSLRQKKILVPGSPLPITLEESRIPVIVLCNPWSDLVNTGLAFDVIIPCGWGNSTWVSLIMNGAVAGGQKQQEAMMTEFCLPPSPFYTPDTIAGRIHSKTSAGELQENYFKRPSNCRENYMKNGVQFPFIVDWPTLFMCHYPDLKDYFVLRDKCTLQQLSHITCKKYNKLSQKRKSSVEKVSIKKQKVEGHDKLSDLGDDETSDSFLSKSSNGVDYVQYLRNLQSVPSNALIYVRLVLLGKGSLEPMSMICLPTTDDLSSNNIMNGTSGNIQCGILELPHNDPNVALREKLKKQHVKNKKKLSRLRKEIRTKARNEGKFETVNDALKAMEDKHQDLIQEALLYNSKMSELWLYAKELPFQQNCARKIFGYVAHAGYNLSTGRSSGNGWVVYGSLLEEILRIYVSTAEISTANATMATPSETDAETKEPFKIESTNNHTVKQKQIFVLVRNPSSLSYRWARLIVLEKVS